MAAQMFTAAAVKTNNVRAYDENCWRFELGQTVGWKTDGILTSVEMDGRGVESVISYGGWI